MFLFCLFSSPNSIWSVLIVCSSIETNTSSGTSYSSVRDHVGGCEGARPRLRPVPFRGYIRSLWLLLRTLPTGRSPGPGRRLQVPGIQPRALCEGKDKYLCLHFISFLVVKLTVDRTSINSAINQTIFMTKNETNFAQSTLNVLFILHQVCFKYIQFVLFNNPILFF